MTNYALDNNYIVAKIINYMSLSFDRNKTQVLKGIALLLMIFHHTIRSGSWVDNAPGVYGFLEKSSKLCVWIFAFLVGYGFYCSSNKSIKYSLKRIALLLVPYWTILFCFFIPLSYVSGTLENIGVKEVFYNMFGLSLSLNWYNWFVSFYILAILSLPFLHIIIKKYPRYSWIVILVGYYALLCFVRFLPTWNTNPYLYGLFNYALLMPNIILGFMCAIWNQEGKLPNWFEGKGKLWICLLFIFVVLVIPGLNIPTKGLPLTAFYTPLLVFAILGIFNTFNMKYLTRFLINVGNVSMYMWFFHAIFFTTTVNKYTRSVVFEPFHCFFYTFVMTFVLSYMASWVIKKLITPIINKIK